MPGSFDRVLRAGTESTDWQELFLGSGDDILYQNGADGRVLWISPSAANLLGVAPESLIGADMSTFAHPDDRPDLLAARAETLSGTAVDVSELRVLTATGDYRTMTTRARPLHDAEGQPIGLLVIWHDITEQVAASRAFTTVVEGTRLLVRAQSEIQLLESMCGLIAAQPGYTFCWYGIPVDDEERSVRVAAMAGNDDGYVASIRTSWGEGPLAEGPTGLALRTGRTQVRTDLEHDAGFGPWRAKAMLRGLVCSIVLPVHVHGAVHGALAVYSTEPAAFDARAQQLLEALATDLGTGIERLRAVDRLARSEARYRLLAENAMDLVAELSVDSTVDWISPSASAVLGYAPEEVHGRPASELFVAEDPVGLQRRLEQDDERTLRAQLRRKDGSALWMELTLHRLLDEHGNLMGRVASARDIDQQVQAEAALEHELEFDSLTGLAKKRLSLSRIQDILDTRRIHDWALLCVGVDGMTAINQAYTHAAGDRVLREVAARIVQAAGTHDRVGRIAGDEFVVTLSDVVTVADAAEAAERILAAARGPIHFGDARVDVTVCVGIAMRTEGDADALLRDATAAMRIASRQGRDRWGFLDENVAASSRRLLETQSRLHDALARGSVTPWFMGIHDLTTGDVVGYEALVRWHNEDGTVTTPDEFLRVAERSSLIVELDRLVLQQSLDVLERLDTSMHVAVNLSAATMGIVDIDEFVRAELDGRGVDPRRLHLEVTETELFDANETTLKQMRALAALGISWWVDDFGTGYSSISHLRDMPVAGVKLDRSFTESLSAGDARPASLTNGLAGLASGLGLRTIAEGVETAEQAALLRDQGWQLGQGFLFGAAGPLQD